MSFSKLSESSKNAVLERLEIRKNIYLKFLKTGRVETPLLIVGDRPGPSAPKIEGYHHTPFYSTKHCSGWLNILLNSSNINESILTWINAYDENGKSYSHNGISDSTEIIALGGNASKWLQSKGLSKFTKVHHPQFWKRFNSKMDYPLIDILRQKVLS